MKVLSVPHVSQLEKGESGIHTVIRSYFRLAEKYGIEFVNSDSDSFDVLAIHAGMSGRFPKSGPIVAHTHGLYWTGDYDFGRWAPHANSRVVDSIRHAKQVTVPSAWVAETFQRDMRMSPHIIPHGIIWEDWQHEEEKDGYVIGYAKNRAGVDVCNPAFLAGFAKSFSDITFVTTFKPPNSPDNVKEIGVVPHETMKGIVQGADVFINTTKETWGIAMLEAMASGVPVLAFNHGGAKEIVRHGVTGYLATPDDYDDLAEGLRYCKRYSKTLGANAIEVAKEFSWDNAMGKLVDVYKLVMEPDPPTVAVVIPVYNKAESEVVRAIDSVMAQTSHIDEIIIVNDGSTCDIDYENLATDAPYKYIYQENQGVAVARNTGAAAATSKYILCLDADDAIEPQFMEVCIPELESDNSLGITYTGLQWIKPDGSTGLSDWPGEFNYDQQLEGKNQVPTACVFRKEAFDRVGGYHKRYAPKGAGEEDANLWLRIPSIGYNARKVSNAGLFVYSWQSGYVSGNNEHTATDWRYWLPWTRDDQHPFASVASPKMMAHDVRQYDEPAVSVVIPVGPGHERFLTDALDSLEAQEFRKWEAIVSWDTEVDKKWLAWFKKAYPYVRHTSTDIPLSGAGAARNRGAELSRAPFLLFLDADDTLHPECIKIMLNTYGETEAGVYTDYIGKANVKNVSDLADDLQSRILEYNEETGDIVILHNALDFDCDRAKKQPWNPPYLWCNITTLIPTAWHVQVGGFDETMESWEDIDYWWRMAWIDKCFVRVPEAMLVYRFHTGHRREYGRGNWAELIKYIDSKKRKMIENGLQL